MKNKNYLIIIILLIASIIVGSSIYEFIPLYTNISHLFQVSNTQAIQTSSAFSLGYAFGFLTVSPLIQRFNTQWLLSINLLLVALTSIAMGTVSDFSLLLILRILQGAFSSFFIPIAFASVWKLVSERNIPFANSMITSGFILASVFGQLFSSVTYQALGWQKFLLIKSILIIILAIVLFKLMPSVRTKNNTIGYFTALKSIFTNKPLFKQYYVTFISLFSFVSMYSLLSINHLVATNNLVAFRSYGLIGIILAMIFIAKIKNAPKHAYLSWSLLSVVLGSLILALFRVEWVLTLGSILFTFGIVASMTLVISNIGTLVQEKIRSVAIVVNAFILFIGATIGPIVINYLNQSTNITVPFVLIAILMGIGSLVEKDYK
ncbi:MFS transporter [Lactiplantibacillus plantarum]|uniref:MFS transporter n=1 Tax=Lactiplantibacillus plantarum TaxID=1590 RepID=UPI000975C02D|nr:MFS transporter [Lactiplantibacillus plantarum]